MDLFTSILKESSYGHQKVENKLWSTKSITIHNWILISHKKTVKEGTVLNVEYLGVIYTDEEGKVQLYQMNPNDIKEALNFYKSDNYVTTTTIAIQNNNTYDKLYENINKTCLLLNIPLIF
jgi:malate synthase